MPPFTSGTVIDSLAKHYPDELWAVRELLSGMQTGLSNIPVDLYWPIVGPSSPEEKVFYMLRRGW